MPGYGLRGHGNEFIVKVLIGRGEGGEKRPPPLSNGLEAR